MILALSTTAPAPSNEPRSPTQDRQGHARAVASDRGSSPLPHRPAVVLSPPRSAPDSISAHQRSRRDPPHTLTTRASGLLNPHRSWQRRRRPLVPRFPPLETFERRPTAASEPSRMGRHPKPFTHRTQNRPLDSRSKKLALSGA